MGSIRSIKTQAKVEEKAAEALKREIQDRQWEEDYHLWQLSHDPNYSEHSGENRPCFGWRYSVREPLSSQCRSCNAGDTCASVSGDFLEYCSRNHYDPGPYNPEWYYDEEQDRLWDQEYGDWIKEQSAQQ